MIALNLNVPADVREQLQAWAKYNCTSMTAELVRSVRDRAAAEKKGRSAGKSSTGLLAGIAEKTAR
ncbi:hypothetical protein AAFX91_00215 [Bradyrhizobium sp. 31Argb]|uniref:hypothetical protein n=1 Tax=Bradyrhizobium sp. 31Argb TaxID=3141247 RepID=UPI003749CCD1